MEIGEEDVGISFAYDREKVESLYPIIVAILRDYNQPVEKEPALVVRIEEYEFRFDEEGKLVSSGPSEAH